MATVQALSLIHMLDALFDSFKERLISLIQQDARKGEEAVDLLMIAKYLERIGDHATNIAEWVVFNITGKMCIRDRCTCRLP